MRDGSNAEAMPAAGPRRQVGQGAVVFAVRPRDNCTAAEAKISVPGVVERPMAGPRNKREELFGEGGCLGARRGRLFRCRLGALRSGRLRFGAAVGPGGSRGGGQFDLGDCHRPRGQQAKHDADAAGGAAGAAFPAPDGPWADAEPPGDAALCDAKLGERCAEFCRGQVARFRVKSHTRRRN